jgi:hypothetical protein
MRDKAHLAPLNDLQEALHAAAAHLTPRMHGATPNVNIAALQNCFTPTVPLVAPPADALPNLRNVISKPKTSYAQSLTAPPLPWTDPSSICPPTSPARQVTRELRRSVGLPLVVAHR